MFFAIDLKTGRVIKTAKNGFDRYAILAKSTGRVYWEGKRYDPDSNEIATCDVPHVRSATAETPQGFVYGTSHRSADLWAFDVRRETLTQVGPGAVGTQGYVAAMHADPTGRYLYYVPGAHGGAAKDGTPVVQFDTIEWLSMAHHNRADAPRGDFPRPLNTAPLDAMDVGRIRSLLHLAGDSAEGSTT